MKKSNKNTLKNKQIKELIQRKETNFTSDFFQTLSNNKLLIGIVAIFVNIGSRYIPINLTKNQEAILKNISTELLIFSITLLMSRDIVTAILLTAAFTVMTRYIFNENSIYKWMLRHFTSRSLRLFKRICFLGR